MTRARSLRLLLAVTAVVCVAAAGCSGDDEEPGSGTASTSTETTPGTKHDRPARARGKPGMPARRRKGKTGGKRPSKAGIERERREEQRMRKEDREFDQAFRESPFEKAVNELPVRKPPLFVEQYITTEGSTTLYTRVAPRRFFCGRSPAARRAAVSAFYRAAAKRFRRRGISDLVQIVTPTAKTAERLPALAIARKGSVSLTRRGRGKGPCATR